MFLQLFLQLNKIFTRSLDIVWRYSTVSVAYCQTLLWPIKHIRQTVFQLAIVVLHDASVKFGFPFVF